MHLQAGSALVLDELEAKPIHTQRTQGVLHFAIDALQIVARSVDSFVDRQHHVSPCASKR